MLAAPAATFITPCVSQGAPQPLAWSFGLLFSEWFHLPCHGYPQLSLTTFPFSECLLSHFLPGAQSSVNIFECINLALLHKGNLPCVIHPPSSDFWLPQFIQEPCLVPTSPSSTCLPPLREVQVAVMTDGDAREFGERQRPLQM